jgi:hypothetical protein
MVEITLLPSTVRANPAGVSPESRIIGGRYCGILHESATIDAARLVTSHACSGYRQAHHFLTELLTWSSVGRYHPPLCLRERRKKWAAQAAPSALSGLDV